MARPLRIFQVIEASGNSQVPGSQVWYRNLYEPLLDLGHDVVLFRAEEGRRARARNDEQLRTQFSERLFETLRAEHAKAPFDLFFAYLIEGMIDPEVIRRISQLGIPTCNFSCNNVHQFHLVSSFARYFDYSLHSELDVGSRFKEVGATPICWPMAANPTYFRPHDVHRDVGVSFVGANYALRPRYLLHLLENDIDVYAAGPGWQWGARTQTRAAVRRALLLGHSTFATSAETRRRNKRALEEFDTRRRIGQRFPSAVHAPLSDDELIVMYSRSAVSLGFLEVFENHDASARLLRHLHLREFEAPMSGALYCTGFLEELGQFFDLDREVIVYRDEYELLDKVRFYLRNTTAAELIRQAGLRRARADHTYHRRFQQLFERLGLG